jgi:hypothetical protein
MGRAPFLNGETVMEMGEDMWPIFLMVLLEVGPVKPDWSDVAVIVMWGACAACVKMALGGLGFN